MSYYITPLCSSTIVSLLTFVFSQSRISPAIIVRVFTYILSFEYLKFILYFNEKISMEFQLTFLPVKFFAAKFTFETTNF